MELLYEGWPGTNTQNERDCTCVFDRADVSTRVCKEIVKIRADGKTDIPTYKYYWTNEINWSDGIYAIAEQLLNEKKRPYIDQLKKSIENYWQAEVLDLTPSWKSLKVNIPKDQMSSDQESRSSDYHMSTRSGDYKRRRQQVKEEMEIEMDMMYSKDGYYDNNEMPYRQETRNQAQRNEVFSDEFYYV